MQNCRSNKPLSNLHFSACLLVPSHRPCPNTVYYVQPLDKLLHSIFLSSLLLGVLSAFLKQLSLGTNGQQIQGLFHIHPRMPYRKACVLPLLRCTPQSRRRLTFLDKTNCFASTHQHILRFTDLRKPGHALQPQPSLPSQRKEFI
jgi:hypothetical protein